MVAQNQSTENLISGVEELKREINNLKEKQKELTNTIKLKEKEIETIKTNNNRFLSIISHDLKGPIGSISGLAELLDKNYEKYNEPKRRRFTKTFNKSLKSVYFLLENLLEWSKFKRDDIQYLPTRINLVEVLDEIININTEFISNKNLSIKYNLNNITKIKVDPDMFKTVMRNLFSNALKFSHDNGNINKKKKKVEHNLIVSVKDDGIGISPDFLNCIFTFDKKCVQSGLNGESGSGLGLALCKEIVNAWNGNIWVESEPGKSTEFLFSIPV